MSPVVLELPPASPAPHLDVFDPSEVRVTPLRPPPAKEGEARLALVDASRAGKGTLEMVRKGSFALRDENHMISAIWQFDHF